MSCRVVTFATAPLDKVIGATGPESAGVESRKNGKNCVLLPLPHALACPTRTDRLLDQTTVRLA